jgi:hypothetical protein
MKKQLLASALAVSLLAACNATPPVGSKPMTQSTADGLKLVAPGMVSAVVNGMRERSQATLQANQVRTQDGGSCAVGGTITDADQDSIPVSFGAAFSNCTLDYVLFFAVKNGTVNISDGNDNDPNSGFSTRASNLSTVYYSKAAGNTLGNPFLGFNHSWDFNLINNAGNYTLAYTYNATLSTYVKNSNTVDKTWKLGLTTGGSYVPAADGNADKFDAGTVNFKGNITYTNDVNEVWTLNVTFDSLTYNASCKAGPVSGKVRFDDGTNNNFLEAVYTGCNVGTLQFNATTKTNF